MHSWDMITCSKLNFTRCSALTSTEIWVNNLLCWNWGYEAIASLWSILVLSSLANSLSITPVEPSRPVFLWQRLVVRVLRSCVKDSLPAINNLQKSFVIFYLFLIQNCWSRLLHKSHLKFLKTYCNCTC